MVERHLGLKLYILCDTVFKHVHTGYLLVANRIAATQQAAETRMRTNNIFTDQDIEAILTHACINEAIQAGYIRRLITVSGLL